MDDPLRLLPGYALRRASALHMNALNARLEPLGLSYTEAAVLLVVGANPGAKISAIGQMLDIKRANMSPLVARMEARGELQRTAVDGRAFGLSLTKDGSDLYAQLIKAVHAHETALLERIPAELRQYALTILDALWTSDN